MGDTDALRDKIAQAIHTETCLADTASCAGPSDHDYDIADAVLPVVTQQEALRQSRDHAWRELRAVRDQISEHLLTHVGGDESDPWQAGHNYAMREAARLVREGFDQL